MAMPESKVSPVARLVVFLFCLSLLGTFVAGLCWYIPQVTVLNEVRAPDKESGTGSCPDACRYEYNLCKTDCLDFGRTCGSACAAAYVLCTGVC